jgi:hypothetical protein
MNQILSRALWIGHAGEGYDARSVLDLEVEAVVDLAVEEPPRATPRSLIVCRFPLIDGSGNRPALLALAVRTVAALVVSETPTLVCCGNGVSRAPAIVAAAMAAAYHGPPEDWLKRVALHHHSDVCPGLWADLVAVLPRVLDLRPPEPAD